MSVERASTVINLTCSMYMFRQGSGSACRSMYGGFVEWEKGEKDDGSDSVAKQVIVKAIFFIN